MSCTFLLLSTIITANITTNFVIYFTPCLQRTYRQDIERERERRQREHFRNDRERSPIDLPSLSRSFRSGVARRMSPGAYDDRRLPRAVSVNISKHKLQYNLYVKYKFHQLNFIIQRSRSPMESDYYDDRESFIRRPTASKATFR